ncbi:hypothetical protein [Histophilus somni]|uniref:hypothetical protein n=1 Tax=Histophilus somni TaxID=731 RepID=UPI00196A5504|nr:hypothetical protein [Histophilus somni]
MSKKLRNWYKRTHDFAPYTRADGKAVSDEFDAIQASFEKMPAMRDDGLGFEESPVIPDPTQDNHPVPLHLLKTAEQSVYAARDKVTELAQQVADNNATTEQNTRLAIQSNEQAQQAKTEASQSATQAIDANNQAQQVKTAVQKAKETAVSSMQSAEQSKNQAIQAENLAKKWASNPQNQIVQEGKYSAYHYALEAEKYAEKVKATAEGRKDWQFIDNVPISKDINDSSETNLASAFSVKTAYDKAVEAEKIANGKSNFKIEQGKDNADDYKTDGHYYFASGQNLPDNGAWHVEVVSGGQATAVRQIARKANDTGVKTRFFNGSNWTAWEDLNVSGLFTYEKTGNYENYIEVRQYPDGTMIQTGRASLIYTHKTYFLYKKVFFHVAFSEPPLIFTSLVKPNSEKYQIYRKDELNVNVISTKINETGFGINLVDDDVHDSDPEIKVDFMAIGRWKPSQFSF